MNKGILFAVAACFIWGLIFVVPLFMDGFSAIEVALGRYFFYGLVSSLLLFRARLKGLCRYPFAIWKKALGFSLLSTIGYYTFVVMSLRYSTPAVSALVLGISPISIAFYGNWKHRECSFRSLVIPSVLILCGLLIINAPHLMESDSPSTYVLGLLCCCWALFTWTWYAVSNAYFLKEHPEIASGDWSTLIGVGTLFWVISFAALLGILFAEQIEIGKYFDLNTALFSFLLGCAALGLLCSWLGGFLWNRASVYLPVSFAGQLMVFETIFGLLFVYSIESRTPPLAECFGIALFLAAILYGIKSLRDVHPTSISQQENS
jgi:drug/metabolite transporter (DMT)-like permease